MFDFKNPDYLPVIRARNERLGKVRADATLLAASLKHYETHPVDFIEDWMNTYDPRRKLTVMPFLLFPKQQEYIYWLLERLEKKEDALVEKSRDMGMTWLNMAFSLWLWRFRSGVKIAFGSRKEDLVDRIGDPDSIFEKGRMILQWLPPEYLPAGFNILKHCPFMKFINPENSSTITGESGDNIGRGGRSTIYFKDESAFYERPERIEAALSQNSDVKIDVSTPNGNGNPFCRKRFAGVIPIFTFHWRDDPRKDDVWYAKQKAKLDPVIVAQEIDIDYNASIEGICIPSNYVQAAVGLKLEASGEKVAGLDVADGGPDSNALVMRHGVVVLEPIYEWMDGNTTQTTRKASIYCIQRGVKRVKYDKIGVGAGVTGESASLKEISDINIEFHPINVGSTHLEGYYDDDTLNKDMFANLKAQLWWEVRRRFERTYEHVNGIKEYPVDQLISIPNHPGLIAELSQPKREFNEAGKIKIESKDKMKARGVKSHNLADALVLCFAPPGKDWVAFG